MVLSAGQIRRSDPSFRSVVPVSHNVIIHKFTVLKRYIYIFFFVFLNSVNNPLSPCILYTYAMKLFFFSFFLFSLFFFLCDKYIHTYLPIFIPLPLPPQHPAYYAEALYDYN